MMQRSKQLQQKGDIKVEKRNRQAVQAVLRAFQLIEIISREGQIGISELTRKSKLSKTTVNRLLATLKLAQVVEQDPVNKRFSLGVRIYVIGNRVLEGLDLRRQARPLIEKFVSRQGKSVLLSTIIQNEVVYIDRFNAPEPFTIKTSIGGRAALHCSASGKVILAFLRPEIREKVLSSISLKRYTPKTITDFAELEMELAAIQKQGYALDLGERYHDLVSVAAPIFDSKGEVIGAISVPRMSATTDVDELKRLGSELVELGRTVSRKMGWSEEMMLEFSG
jgi:DNA-binding IclR family transcriptional regulator